MVQVDHYAGDVRRGQRFKRLSRYLSSTSGKRKIDRFQMWSLLITGMVLVVTIACFVSAYMMITAQRDNVRMINIVGGWMGGGCGLGQALRMCEGPPGVKIMGAIPSLRSPRHPACACSEAPLGLGTESSGRIPAT